MNAFTIQTLFLLYSALSVLAAGMITALFWHKKDTSARIWIVSCLLTSLATVVTVNRDVIPLIISYSLMVSFEALSLLLLSESIKRLNPQKNHIRISHLTWFLPSLLFVIVEYDRYQAHGQLTASMTAATALVCSFANLYCFYQTISVSKHFKNRLFFKLIGTTVLIVGLLYILRTINVLSAYSQFAFDLKSYNLAIWFFLILFGSIRNLAYISLRLHLGFVEHVRLDTMNTGLTNLIDERNAMILSLEKLNKWASVNALASTIAHEINQPLAAIKLNAEFIEFKLNDHPEATSLLREINQNIIHDIDRVSSIIKSLRNLSISNIKVKRNVQLLESLNEVIEISKRKLNDEKISIRLDCDQSCEAFVNEGEFQQVLINVLNNAIEALANTDIENKEISISMYRRGEAIEITVQDNGSGITPGQEAQIFELLISNKKTGSGIGLWLSKDIVKRYGGNIWAANIPGSGAKFTIQIPVDADA